MIDMAMRYQYRVDPSDVRSQRLLPEIRRRIDQYGRAVMFDEDGRTKPFIPRVFRQARLAIARDRWYTC